MLELKSIHKSYQFCINKQHVLKRISINFRKNEFVYILGQSGSELKQVRKISNEYSERKL